MKLIQTVKRRMGGEDKPAEPSKSSATASSKSTSSSKSRDKKETPAADLKLRDVNATEKTELFRSKLKVCREVFDFSKDDNAKQKDVKRQTLLEIVEYVNNTRNCFNETLMQDVLEMVGLNIFRTLKTRSADPFSVMDDEDEPNLEPSWPHLQIVYEFFLRFVVSNDVDPKIAKQFVNHVFLTKLFELFSSEDPRERDYLKTILHRIYGKFMALRSFIRRTMQNVFYKVIYEDVSPIGLAELLEILGSIINGFALPLKDEHKDLLTRGLLPLHKVISISVFDQQLIYCMCQYIEKEPRLSHDVVMGMLRYWPSHAAAKQVFFLNELEEILGQTPTGEVFRLRDPLFARIAACIACPHFQVAERTLFYWNNEQILELISEQRTSVFPVLIPALHQGLNHWNAAVKNLTINVMQLMVQMDEALFLECKKLVQDKLEADEKRTQERADKWARYQAAFDAKAR